MNNLEPILLPIDRVADMIGKCRRSIYELIASGQLQAVKSGRNTLVVYDSVKGYVAGLPAARFKQYPSQVKRLNDESKPAA
jgi:excisionase family DNA binding protein